ncbi:MAG: O-antigen ligase family protein [Patescibacteria group bacterium]|nr:O-antigen ligase family protein [Patescibacteria group bacterium]
MSAKIYQRILQVGVFVSLGVIFLLFGNLLFPYISSKQLVFNALIELLLPFWLVLVWKFPDFRPQKSLITWGLIAYLAAILLSAFTGVDFNLSFWGDVERLLGVFHVFHFFIFYLYLITAFRNREDWYWLLSASVLAATVEAIIIVRGAAIGTIGNTAYVSGYMLFNLYFAVILLLRTHWKWQWPFYGAIILMLIAFFKADTSGAIVGLAGSLALLLLLFGLLALKKGVRRFSWLALIVAVTGVIVLFSQYQQPWFKANPILHDLSFNKNTFQTRRLSWEGAARDFHLHPWLGTGFGNYAIIFDRQFDPSFFNYALTETYFDRAHNNLIDIVSTAGLIGLLAYLAIFIAAAWDWYATLRRRGGRILPGKDGMPVRELLVVAALLAAYFVQNLAVFDSLATYMGLMIALAYLVFSAQTEKDMDTDAPVRLSSFGEGSVLLLSMILMVISVILFTVRPWQMLNRVISGYSYIAQNQVSSGFLAYRQAFAAATPLDRDGRTTLINIIVNNPTIFTKLPDEQVQPALEFAASMAEKNLAYNPDDSLAQMQAAQLYDIISRYYSNEPSVFKDYSDKALAAIQHSLASSPRRIPVYFILAQVQANRGDLPAVEQALRTAESLNPDYIETACQLGNYYFLVENSVYQEYIDRCLDKGGNSAMPNVLQAAIEHYLADNDSARLLSAYRLLAQKGSTDALMYVNLAKAELAAGNIQAALQAAIQAADIDSSLRPAVQAFLKGISSNASTSPVLE